MAITPTTLASLIQMVRFRTNTESSSFVTDAEITAYLNSSLAELDDLLVTTYDDFKVTASQATITSSDPTADTNFFSLPADFYKARGVDWLVGGAWSTLQPFNLQKRNTYSYPASALPLGFAALYYRIQGARCYVIPAQQAAGTYRLWYVPAFAPLVLTTDTLPSYMDLQAWSEFAVVDCAIKIQVKQDLDASAFMAEKQGLQARVVNAAKTRDAGPPRRIVNTRAEHDGGPGSGWGRW